jgi:hypothetical protein
MSNQRIKCELGVRLQFPQLGPAVAEMAALARAPALVK